MVKYILYNKNTKQVKAIGDKEPVLSSKSKLSFIKINKSNLELDKFSRKYKTEVRRGKIVHIKKINQSEIKSINLKTELGKAKTLEEIKRVVEQLL